MVVGEGCGGFEIGVASDVNKEQKTHNTKDSIVVVPILILSVAMLPYNNFTDQ